MPRNGSGTYTRPQPNYVPGTTILATSVNSDLNDMGEALTASIARDGQTIPTANLPMGNFRHTGVADGSARTDYAALGQTQNGAFLWGGTAGGTANAATINLNPPLAAYAAGQRFAFVASAANTGAVTLNVNGLGATAVNKGDGTVALTAGDIPSGAVVTAQHDGTRFRLIDAGVGVFAAGTAALPGLAVSGDPNTGIFSPGADQLAFSTNGTEVLRIVSGDFGFGTPAPGVKYDFRGQSSFRVEGSGLIQNGIDGVNSINWQVGSDGTAIYIGTQTNHNLRITTNNIERLRVANDGSRSSVIPGGSTLFPEFQCRAWVNFNGTGTVAIRASGNVSSITDNGTGDYTVNFTTNMPDVNYAPMVVIEQSGVAGGSATEAASISSQTTSAFRFACKYSYSIFSAGATSNRYDPNTVSVTITR